MKIIITLKLTDMCILVSIIGGIAFLIDKSIQILQTSTITITNYTKTFQAIQIELDIILVIGIYNAPYNYVSWIFWEHHFDLTTSKSIIILGDFNLKQSLQILGPFENTNFYNTLNS